MEAIVYEMPDVVSVPDSFLKYKESLRTDHTPIIIDNGSWQCRAGWANEKKPNFTFKNLTAKNRGKKDAEIQVGNDITNIEAMRWLLKSQFDRNVVVQFDNQEAVFDHIFSHLGINSSTVDHPIVITEPFLNPNSSRALMAELLFECYQIPSLATGVDSLFSYYKNIPSNHFSNGLIVSCGYQSCQVLPVIKGKVDSLSSQRLNLGGVNKVGFLHRLLQLKYPGHFASITISRSEELVHQHCFCSNEYQDDLKEWSKSQFYNSNVRKIQLQFTPPPGGLVRKTLNKTERCQAMIERLEDVHSKRRLLKLAADEEKLNQLKMIEELYEESDLDLFQRALHEFGYTSLRDLQLGIVKLNKHVKKMKTILDATGYSSYGACEDLELCQFSDPEMWILAVRKKWEDYRDMSLNKLNRERGLIKAEEMDYENEFEIVDDLLGQEILQELEDILREYDGEFNKEHEIDNYAFNMAEYYQIHLGIERIRVPELLFQPSMLGIDQAGIAESIQNVLKRYSVEEQRVLTQNVFLHGGCFATSGFKTRIESELRQMLPFRSEFKVTQATNPVLDAWFGAQKWAKDPQNAPFFVKRQDYEENGADFFKEHCASNFYFPYVQPTKIA